MKTHFELMVAVTKKPVFDQPPAFSLIESDGPPVCDGRLQPRVPGMFGHKFVQTYSCLPEQDPRVSLVPNYKRDIYISRILFDSVDLHSRMIRSRTKLMSLLQVRTVNISTRINNEGPPQRRHFNTQGVVVSVGAAAVESGAARIKTEVQIFFPHYVGSRVRKSLRHFKFG